MLRIQRTLVATELLLLVPASLFMTALLVRRWGPLEVEPAHTAQEIAMWYASRQWTLPVLLVILPLAALAFGATALRTTSNSRGTRALILTAMAVASAILVRVAMHMLG